ncbi:SDR family oxidoreductase [Candidatus Gottesmanbacteria bacterium]|nr:SDR family oxidoreductase [Candidatus Gottesmanbacteria bacterium]
MNIIGTGLSGLVGSRVVELLQPEFQFENLSLETGFDITHTDAVMDRIGKSHASWVFHFAATTDLEAAEKERQLGQNSKTWRVNVGGTRNVVQAAYASKKHVLYLSTDFVFDGESGPYTEQSRPNPQSWYAITKYEGEKLVSGMGEGGLIVRIAFPYKAGRVGRESFLHRIVDLMMQGKTIQSPNDQLFMPTLIDDIARAMSVLVSGAASGIYHVVSPQALSPYEAARKIAAAYGLDAALVVQVSSAEYYKDRAPRPFHAVLKHDKIDALGIRIRSFDEGLALIKSQESEV